jgi:hypothetical protein
VQLAPFRKPKLGLLWLVVQSQVWSCWAPMEPGRGDDGSLDGNAEPRLALLGLVSRFLAVACCM